jgi:hypothetical protein
MSRTAVTKDLVAAQARSPRWPGLGRVYESLARQAREEHWGFRGLPARGALRGANVAP